MQYPVRKCPVSVIKTSFARLYHMPLWKRMAVFKTDTCMVEAKLKIVGGFLIRKKKI